MYPFVVVAFCPNSVTSFTDNQPELHISEKENQDINAVWTTVPVLQSSVAPGTVCDHPTVWQVRIPATWSWGGNTTVFDEHVPYAVFMDYVVAESTYSYEVAFEAVFADERAVREASGQHIRDASFAYPLLALKQDEVEQLPFQAYIPSFGGTTQAFIMVCSEFARNCYRYDDERKPPKDSDVELFMKHIRVGFNFNEKLIDTVLTADALRTGKRFAIRAADDVSHLNRNLTVFVGVRVEAYTARPASLQ